MLGLAATTIACVKIPNPYYVDEAGSDTFADATGTGESGDGDGDGDPTTGDGDGDGDPTTGDGDGDGEPTTGDGDGEPCSPGELDCPCDMLQSCDDGLACVLGDCLAADSCGPVNDGVILSATPIWLGGDPPPEPPSTPATFICVLNGQVQGQKAVFSVQQCGAMALLQQLVLEIEPMVEPISELLGNPNLAATVTVVVKPEGFFVRIEANGMDLYYLNGTSLFAEGITEYPWAIAPFSSSCGQTPSMCGILERLALLVDDGIVFDGNAEQASDAATVWAETVLDECGVNQYEVALLAY